MKTIQPIQSLVGNLTGIAAIIGALIAAITFFWNIVQFLWTRTQESRNRQFETYHKLVKQLVQEPSPDKQLEGASPDLYIDRQAAVVFELRHFPRYYGYTERMLNGLKEREKGTLRILAEIDLTLKYVQRKWRYRLSKFMDERRTHQKVVPK
jgi:hypothetical protein